ncbi:MAG: phosphomannomutase/phosphoglucomutase [Alphaproteobacteria bacterium]|nr:phosphomannomutase/phosphoglucomutase [Alphaproteobacteria bacterium]
MSSLNRVDRALGPHQMDASILREYDIRGKVGKTLTADDAFALGLAFGTKIRRAGGSSVCVGYDGRHSSPELADAVIDGLVLTGMNVENVGLGPTPMLYFAVKDRMSDGGIMVTGSHNPPEYNGFKITLQTGPVFGDGVQELGHIAASGDFETGHGEGSVRTIDVRETYVDRLLRDFDSTREVRIAWDAGNGAVGAVLHTLVARLPGDHVLLYDNVDGNFPNHHPDPTVDENLIDLQQAVREHGCNFGVAFDGDGDRIGVVDSSGNVIRCDILMAIYARDVLADHPRAVIIGDVKCSQVMFDEIARLGGIPVMWKTGHSLIKSKMAETKALLAGELSGHIFFADKYYGFDDALYCAVRLISAFSDAGDDSLADMLAHLPSLYSTPELRFEVEESEKFAMIDHLAAGLAERLPPGCSVDLIDGVRVNTPDGWWLLRASNTQNVLVTRAEASSRGGIDRLKEMVVQEVALLGYNISFPEREI